MQEKPGRDIQMNVNVYRKIKTTTNKQKKNQITENIT